MEKTLSVLIHGDPGVGKSHLSASTPAPRLILDTEGRAKFTPGRKIAWDPARDAPPVADGTWDTAIVRVDDFNILQQAYQWLRSGQHPFTSVSIDSLMMAQKRAIDTIAGQNQMTTQDWGTLLRRLENLVRSYHDLTLYPETKVKVVVFTSGGDEGSGDGGRNQPLLQGQLKKSVAYYLDAVGYMFAESDADGTGTNRFLLVHPRPNIVAKDNTGQLGGPVIANPNLAVMFDNMHFNGDQTIAAAPAAAETKEV